MEKVPTNKRVSDVEAEANYEGNETLLLFERLSNPVIFNQIVDLFVRNEQSLAKKKVTIHVFDEEGNKKYDEKGRPVLITGLHEQKTREQIIQRLRETIEDIKKDTPVSFNPGDKSNAKEERELVAINQELFPGSGLFLGTQRQKSITEAHEKGHVVRRYYGPVFKRLFSGVIERSAMRKFFIGRDVYEEMLENAQKKGLSLPSYEQLVQESLDYLSSPVEIAERMSQLKNYFGMEGNEVFTKEHLDYAKDNYVKDTGLDNNMAVFFAIITPGTERKFLEIINSAGI